MDNKMTLQKAKEILRKEFKFFNFYSNCFGYDDEEIRDTYILDITKKSIFDTQEELLKLIIVYDKYNDDWRTNHFWRYCVEYIILGEMSEDAFKNQEIPKFKLVLDEFFKEKYYKCDKCNYHWVQYGKEKKCQFCRNQAVVQNMLGK